MATSTQPDHPVHPSRRDERGTVLIFVVGVLVLLALAATAYLSTARVDRTTTKQNEFNTQVDLLLEGCRQAVISTLLADPSVLDEVQAPQSSDSIWPSAASNDNWLASRVPTLYSASASLGFNAAGTNPAAWTNPGTWRAITGPLVSSHFETPTGQVISATSRINLVPFGIQYAGRMQPVLTHLNAAGTALEGGLDLTRSDHMYFAGDADADGIADSLPIRLPVGRINGLDYYAYFRIIDNNSAIDANTAMSRNFDFGNNDNVMVSDLHFYSSNIGLAEFLYGVDPNTLPTNMRTISDDFTRLIAFRGRYDATAAAPHTAYFDLPIEDLAPAGVYRTDFAWKSLGDAMHHQLGVRTENPGRLRRNDTDRYRSFSFSDTASLASRYLLRDSLGMTSEIETVFNDTLSIRARNTPLVADQSQSQWFPNYFHYDADVLSDPLRFASRRVLLTANAGLRNIAPKNGMALGGAVPPVVIKTMAPIPSGTLPKVSINTAGFSELFRAFWMVMADTATFTGNHDNAGTIFNTADIIAEAATFDPYRGMKFAPNTSVPDVTQPMNSAAMFRSPIRSVPDSITPAVTYTSAVRMTADQVLLLRAAIAAKNLESIRALTAGGYAPWQGNPGVSYQVGDNVRYRAAHYRCVANHTSSLTSDPESSPTEWLKVTTDTPDVARFADIELKAASGGDITARIFGIQRQPYITEIFAQNDTDTAGPLPGGSAGLNVNGYVAIELYNPHDVPIDLTNCRIATLHRLRSTIAGAVPPDTLPEMTLHDTRDDTTYPIQIDDTTGTFIKSNLDDPTRFSTPMIIPARGYLVLENYDASGLDPDAAKYRPGSVASTAFPTLGQVLVTRASGPDFNVVYVKNLHMVLNREFILMRPLGAGFADRNVAENLLAATNVPTLVYAHPSPAPTAPNIRNDYMPLDSYDLSGIGPFTTTDPSRRIATGTAYAWHYQRSTENWQFVYPGRYDAAHTNDGNPASLVISPRQMGTLMSGQWDPSSHSDTWDPDADAARRGPTYMSPPLTNSPTFSEANLSVRQLPNFSIQLLNDGSPGPNPLQPGSNNSYPFGKFGRAGDLLQVPFIGSYILINTASASVASVIEVNPITMDAAMAEDTDTLTDPIAGDDASDSREQIGRFCPLRTMDATAAAGTPLADPDDPNAKYGDYGMDPSKFRYAFARKLFEYFDVRSPADDYLPNVKSGRDSWMLNKQYVAGEIVRNTTNTQNYRCIQSHVSTVPGDAPPNTLYWNPTNEQTTGDVYFYYDQNRVLQYISGRPSPTPTLLPMPVQNGSADVANRQDGDATNDETENEEPTRGRININTAPFKVLSMIPWVPPARDTVRFDPTDAANGYLVPGANSVDDNEDFARALLLWRDGDFSRGVVAAAPMQTIFDIYRAPPAISMQRSMLNADPNDDSGDFSPRGNNLDGVRYDFEEQYLLLNRVSNLITTRSDTFTVYILLQGYRNTGTANPELVVERRASMIVDRSRFTETNGTVTATKVPTN